MTILTLLSVAATVVLMPFECNLHTGRSRYLQECKTHTRIVFCVVTLTLYLLIPNKWVSSAHSRTFLCVTFGDRSCSSFWDVIW